MVAGFVPDAEPGGRHTADVTQHAALSVREFEGDLEDFASSDILVEALLLGQRVALAAVPVMLVPEAAVNEWAIVARIRNW